MASKISGKRDEIAEKLKEQVTAIIPAPKTAVAAYDPYAIAAGDDTFDELPGMLPYLTIDQKKGEFVFPDGSRTNRIIAAILGFPKSRTMFNPKIGKLPQYFCRASQDSFKHPGRGILNPSLDAAETSRIIKEGAGGYCLRCQLKEWKLGPEGRDEKPECTEALNLLLHILGDEESVAILKASRTSLKPTNAYLNGFKMKKQKPWGYETIITLLEQQSLKPGIKPWVILKFERGAQLDKDQFVQIENEKEMMDAAMQESLRQEPDEPEAHQFTSTKEEFTPNPKMGLTQEEYEANINSAPPEEEFPFG